MQADQLSALGGLVGAGVAFVALIFSVYATLIARRSARAAEKQVEIAARSYHLSAAPDIEFELRIEDDFDNDVSIVEVCVSYANGPPKCWCRTYLEATLFSADSVQKSGDRTFGYWFQDLMRGHSICDSWTFPIPLTSEADRLVVHTAAELIEPPGEGDPDSAPRWTASRRFTEYPNFDETSPDAT